MFGSNDIYAEATKDASINVEERELDRRKFSLNNLFTVFLVFGILYLGIKYFMNSTIESTSTIAIQNTKVMGVTHVHVKKEDAYLNILESMDIEPLLETSQMERAYQSNLSQQMSRIVESSSVTETSAYTQALSKEILGESKKVDKKNIKKLTTPSVDVLYQAELSRAMSLVIDFSLDNEDKQYIQALSQEI